MDFFADVLNVQFEDDTQAKIVAYLGVPEDPAIYPHQGTVSVSDERWKAFYAGLGSAIDGIPVPDLT